MGKELRPVKVGERTHIQRQFLRWSKYWMSCQDKEKKEKLLRQMINLGEIVERDLQKQKE